MASTGNVFPTVGANVDRASSTAWTNPGNVVSDDATDTTVVVPSDYLVTSGYDFSVIPDGSTILGITVRVEASETGSGTSTYIPQLHSDTTPTLIGSAKTAVTVSGATKVISTNGSTSDTWGASLTAAIVKNSGFGVSIWSTDTVNTLAIDFVTIAVEYVAPATGDFSKSLPMMTLAAAGAVAVQGASGFNIPMLTLSAEGGSPPPELFGALSVTLPVLTLSAAGAVAVQGALGVSIPMLTLVAAGAISVVGALSAVLPMLTLLAAGVHDYVGSGGGRRFGRRARGVIAYFVSRGN